MGNHALTGVEGFQRRTDMFYIDPRQVKVVDGWNPRKDFSGEDELMASIIAEGVKQPLKIRRNENREIELVDGERRLRATLRAIKEGNDIKSVPAIAVRYNMSEIDLYLEALIANAGKPLTPVEEAESFKRLLAWGVEIKEIAAKTCRSETHVRNRLSLADAVPAVKEAVTTGEITTKDAVQIVKESDGKVDPQTKALNEKKSAPKKPRARALHFFIESGEVKTKGKNGEKCDPLLDILNDVALRTRILEAGYDPETLKVSVLKREKTEDEDGSKQHQQRLEGFDEAGTPDHTAVA